MDPIATPLLISVFGNLDRELVTGARQDDLKDKLKGLFSKAEKLGSKDNLQLAYEGAMQQAYETCCVTSLRLAHNDQNYRSIVCRWRSSSRTERWPWSF